MITGLQIKAARALLRLSAAELAEMSSVSLSTIQRLERFDGVPAAQMSSISPLYEMFLQAGIEFLGTPDEDPSVRLRTK